jgi:hypothetical protein
MTKSEVHLVEFPHNLLLYNIGGKFDYHHLGKVRGRTKIKFQFEFKKPEAYFSQEYKKWISHHQISESLRNRRRHTVLVAIFSYAALSF